MLFVADALKQVRDQAGVAYMGLAAAFFRIVGIGAVIDPAGFGQGVELEFAGQVLLMVRLDQHLGHVGIAGPHVGDGPNHVGNPAGTSCLRSGWPNSYRLTVIVLLPEGAVIRMCSPALRAIGV